MLGKKGIKLRKRKEENGGKKGLLKILLAVGFRLNSYFNCIPVIFHVLSLSLSHLDSLNSSIK